jgi:prophage antirepressor-like protein
MFSDDSNRGSVVRGASQDYSTSPPEFSFVRDGELCHFIVNGAKCRGLLYKGKWAWVGRDVAKAIGIREDKVAQATRGSDYTAGVDYEVVALDPHHGVSALLGIDRRAHSLTLLYRNGLLQFLILSSTATGRALRRWLADDVLPSIIDNNAYTLPGAAPQSADLAGIATAIAALTDSNTRLFTVVSQLISHVIQDRVPAAVVPKIAELPAPAQVASTDDDEVDDDEVIEMDNVEWVEWAMSTLPDSALHEFCGEFTNQVGVGPVKYSEAWCRRRVDEEFIYEVLPTFKVKPLPLSGALMMLGIEPTPTNRNLVQGESTRLHIEKYGPPGTFINKKFGEPSNFYRVDCVAEACRKKGLSFSKFRLIQNASR